MQLYEKKRIRDRYTPVGVFVQPAASLKTIFSETFKMVLFQNIFEQLFFLVLKLKSQKEFFPAQIKKSQLKG